MQQKAFFLREVIRRFAKSPYLYIGCLLAAVLCLGRSGSAVAQTGDYLPIHLAYYTFDPLVDGEPAIAAGLRATPASRYVLLQLNGPVQVGWGEALQAAGVTFHDYLAEYTFLVHLPPGGAAAVAHHPAVRWLGPYHPAYRLSPRATSGRLLLDLFPSADLTTVIPLVRAAGARIIQSEAAERGHLLLVEADVAVIPALAAIEGVRWLQNAAPMVEVNDQVHWVAQSYLPYVPTLYDKGLSGAGQVGAAADSGITVYDFPGGLLPTIPSCFFLDDGNGGAGGIALPPSNSHRKVLDYAVPNPLGGDMEDGSGHGSHVVGSIVGDRPPWNTLSPADGMAYNARVYFQDIGLGPGTINPPLDYTNLFGPAYDPNGDNLYQPPLEPRTHSNSWGSAEKEYRPESAQTDSFMWNQPDFLILYAVGNNGPAPATVGYPANAKNIVSVGATENAPADPDSITYFSSHGPTLDNRLTPTISAPGDRIVSALYNNACGTAERSGSSMAAPAVQGIALLMREYLWKGYYPGGEANPADQHHPSAALLKALLMNSGRPMGGWHSDNSSGGTWPSNGQGWGRVTADDALYFQGDHRALWLHDEYDLTGTVGLTLTDTTRTFVFTVGDGQPLAAEPLEVTLVWTDYPGTAGVGTLVNNLNLTVTDPAGGVHLGNDTDTNDFQGIAELPPVTTLTPDSLNPWEVVYLANPTAGTYTVTVNLANMPSALLDERKQGFALVVTGDLIQQHGRAEIEFPFYEPRPLETAYLRVTDLGLNNNPAAIETVTALINSTTQPAGFTVVLTETAANSAIFAGQVTLTLNTPTAGQLAVANGDTVRLEYNDANTGLLAVGVAYDTAEIASRPVNFVNPPELTDPGTVDDDGIYTLNWTAAGESAGLNHYRVQETTVFTRPLLDNAEGSITTNWTTGTPAWQPNALYAHSPGQSYWSGDGTSVGINTSLTLRYDVTIPLTATHARLTFYSRYYNDLNDYGFVEISTNGGASWSPLLVLNADPLVNPPDAAVRHYQVDLTDYIGTPFRIRFRYDNGMVNVPPPVAPGWWLDDITISGGAWQTIATIPPGITSYGVAGRDDGRYFYRVQAIYHDGSASAESDVEDMLVSTPTAIRLRQIGSSEPAKGWVTAVLVLGLVTFAAVARKKKAFR
jgi:hypothetical protein